MLLTWLDMPNDGEPGELMPGILWDGFAALGLTQVLFTATPEDAPAPRFRRITPELAMADGPGAFMDALDFDQADSWRGDQCYFAVAPGQLPRRSDPELEAWQPFWSPKWTKTERPVPTRMPKHVPLLMKVQDDQDAAWAVALADSAQTIAAYDAAVAGAARARGVQVSHPAEQTLMAPEVWARYGPGMS